MYSFAKLFDHQIIHEEDIEQDIFLSFEPVIPICVFVFCGSITVIEVDIPKVSEKKSQCIKAIKIPPFT